MKTQSSLLSLSLSLSFLAACFLLFLLPLPATATATAVTYDPSSDNTADDYVQSICLINTASSSSSNFINAHCQTTRKLLDDCNKMLSPFADLISSNEATLPCAAMALSAFDVRLGMAKMRKKASQNASATLDYCFARLVLAAGAIEKSANITALNDGKKKEVRESVTRRLLTAITEENKCVEAFDDVTLPPKDTTKEPVQGLVNWMIKEASISLLLFQRYK